MARKPVTPTPMPKSGKLTGNEMYSTMTVGARLRLTRQALGYNQAQWAEHLSIRREAYCMYEIDKREPPPAIALEMKRAFRITLDWIYDSDSSGLSQTHREAIQKEWRKKQTGN